MSRNLSLPRLIIAWALLSIGAVACGTGTPQAPATQAQAKPATRWSHQDWPTVHYKLVEGWPKPLPDTRHSHDGWTWGSFGGVYAENPDRIWVAMRGEPGSLVRKLRAFDHFTAIVGKGREDAGTQPLMESANMRIRTYNMQDEQFAFHRALRSAEVRIQFRGRSPFRSSKKCARPG